MSSSNNTKSKTVNDTIPCHSWCIILFIVKFSIPTNQETLTQPNDLNADV